MDQEKKVLPQLLQEKQGDVLLLLCQGRLDALSSPSVEKEVFHAIQEGEKKLIFDFSNVEYLSSAGMRMLLSISKKLRTSSGRMVVCSIPANILDLLKVAGFDHVLEITATREEAFRKQ